MVLPLIGAKAPAGPTASPRGLNAVEVNTDEVKDDSADDMSGEVPWLGGSSPKLENIGGGPGLRPGLGGTGC